jgi:hypothetical protein
MYFSSFIDCKFLSELYENILCNDMVSIERKTTIAKGFFSEKRSAKSLIAKIDNSERQSSKNSESRKINTANIEISETLTPSPY